MEDREAGFRIGRETHEDVSQTVFTHSGREDRPPVRENQRADRKRLDRINRRLSLISVLLPCLLAVILYFFYQDVRKRFDQMGDNGATEARATAEQLKQDVADLSEKYRKLKTSIDEKEAPMNEVFLVFEKTAGSLKEGLAGVRERLDAMDAAKADTQQLADEAARLTAALVPLQESLQGVRDQVQSLDEKYAAQFAALDESRGGTSEEMAGVKEDLGGMKDELARMKADTIDVLSTTIDRKALNAAIKKQTGTYQRKISSLTQRLSEKESEIRALQKKVRALDSRMKSIGQKSLGTPKPGTFIEQDLP
ncbi:hypothetical protein DENIS_1673 [Desulfonema ishimotonii]|uniref:Chromosome partition protein Smc n=1 Tax=Desulfonema ishimotonii TaxID=45657 RepID=A0A401FUS5_9BACT|nr:hypothetical protein [Desulfonema ishimotonii]GBC60716.1 hypothetical protein DENIS_1673 [Desulfonema ishimotonii]